MNFIALSILTVFNGIILYPYYIVKLFSCSECYGNFPYFNFCHCSKIRIFHHVNHGKMC